MGTTNGKQFGQFYPMILVLVELLLIFIVVLLILRVYDDNISRLICISAVFAITLSIFIDAGFHYLNEEIEKNAKQSGQSVQDLPVVLWWTPFLQSSSHVRECYSRRCTFTDDRRMWNTSAPKALAFYGTSVNVTDLPLPRNEQMWALLHEESPRNNPHLLSEHLLSLFNFTSTFSRRSHLPLTFLHVEKMNDLRDLKYFVSTEEKNALRTSLAPILYVQSNCDTLTNRDAYVAELGKFVDIDSYGNCLHNTDLPQNLTGSESFNSDEFLNFVAQYKFTLAIENAVCEDYMSEKLWRSLIVGSVPIYFGSPSVRDWLPNFDAAILISEFSEPRELAEYIKQLDKEDVRYNDFLHHKTTGGISNNLLKSVLRSRRYWDLDSAIEEFECQLCLRLHRPGIQDSKVDKSHYECDVSKTIIDKPVKGNDWEATFKSGRCDGLAASEFISSNVSYTAEELRNRSAEFMIAVRDEGREEIHLRLRPGIQFI